MLAGFLLGIVHDRRLMREAQVNLAIRWFADQIAEITADGTREPCCVALGFLRVASRISLPVQLPAACSLSRAPQSA
jgi:hypothetical protein